MGSPGTHGRNRVPTVLGDQAGGARRRGGQALAASFASVTAAITSSATFFGTGS